MKKLLSILSLVALVGLGFTQVSYAEDAAATTEAAAATVDAVADAAVAVDAAIAPPPFAELSSFVITIPPTGTIL